MIKRLFVISACLVALIVVIVFPAGAAGIDYNDYITDVRVDGSNDIVTVSLPLSSLEWFCYDPDNKYVSGVGSSFTYSFNADDDYLVRIRAPLLDLTNIPSDTIVNLQYEFSLPSGAFVDSGNLTFYNYNFFYGNSGLITNKSSVGETGPGFTFSASFNIGSVSGATSVQIESRLAKFSVFNSSMGDLGPITFSTKQFDLVMTISSLYRLQQQTGKTNQILNEVEKQLEANGQTLQEVLDAQQQTNDQLGDLNDKQDQTNDKLDDIINGDVDSSLPSGGDVVGDLDDAESQIRDDAQSGLDQGVDVQQSALQILAQYWSAFACVGWIFSKFTDLPFFSGLLYVSFALGITGSILGLGLSLARAGDASAARQAAAEVRQDSYYRRLGRGKKGG